MRVLSHLKSGCTLPPISHHPLHFPPTPSSFEVPSPFQALPSFPVCEPQVENCSLTSTSLHPPEIRGNPARRNLKVVEKHPRVR